MDTHFRLTLALLPAQLQGRDVSSCHMCGAEMDVLMLQLDSQDSVFRDCFGDAGIAHIFQCKEHPENFDMAWQCM